MNRTIRRINVITVFCLAAVVFSNVAGAANPKREKELIATLKCKAPQAAKDLACRELQVIGTEACIDARPAA